MVGKLVRWRLEVRDRTETTYQGRENYMINYIVEQIENLVNIHSPSGYTDEAVAYVREEVGRYGYELEQTEKGAVYVTLKGNGDKDTLGIAAHLDTLGAMVRSINSDGTIRFTSVGSYLMSSVNGEYCTIYTRDHKTYTGTILSKQPSVHVYPEISEYKLVEENMHVRLDELVATKEETEGLGIEVGNIIGFDPRFQRTASGYVKSRHLDDKASAALLLALLKNLKDEQVVLPYDLKVLFSTYEEVGHGAAYIPEEIKMMLAIDMGTIGDDLACTEEDVSICVKDSSGPYDRHMVDGLLKIAKEKKLGYSLDVYPRYSSDASAALRGGANIRAALIGPGVHASHHMERTHEDGLMNTFNLMVGYLESL